MQTRPLGNSDLTISAVGLGLMGMSDFYGNRDARDRADTEHIATIRGALDMGMNFLDTADMYGCGENEKLLGRALRDGYRDKAVVATKFGNERNFNGGFIGVNGKPEYVRAACDASLRRLGIDTIDLYYQHRVDRSVPIEETVGAMKELVEAGKVRYLGLSEAAPATIRKAHAVHPISALQTEYSLWTRDPEGNDVLATCRELGITFVAYSPLGRGFLTGTISKPADLDPGDWRLAGPRFQGENFQKNLDLVAHITSLAANKGCTPAQLALAWLLAREPFVVPIPGTTKLSRVDENAGACAVTLSADELAKIDEILPPDVAAGTRYPEAAMRALHG
jgi:aryl-alcohol dehydrogenase-like predicted oxidoreductase